MGIPIPVIYLAEEDDCSYSAIGGQQRLTALFSFLDNKLSLRGLNVFSEFNGSIFQQMPRDMQNKIREFKLRMIVIKRDSEPEIRFEIFERLNTGSVNLNPQELRNCIYRGSYNVLLADLSKDPEFLRLFGRTKPDRRMVDREAILRFFALCQNLPTYKPTMKKFLNDEMALYRNAGEETLRDTAKLFKKSVQLTLTVFGDHAFKRFYPGTAEDPNGRWEPKRLNMALFDAVMVGFTGYEPNQVVPRSDAACDALIDLMVGDAAFVDAINLGTSGKDQMQTRMHKWTAKLHEVLGAPTSQPRLFPPELKRQMFNQSQICAMCGQTIRLLDDAHLGHVEQRHRGGQTIPENARLTHRFCNISRPRDD